MKINAAGFGTQEINPETVLSFPRGLLGFENCTRFQLFHEEKDHPLVYWMQSLDEPEVAFSIVDPAEFGFNYELTLTDEEAALLQAENPADIGVLLLVYKPLEGQAAQTVQNGGIAANINGPIILNVRARRGLQKVLASPGRGVTAKDAAAV
ncbi:MAG: flagellar assembly protein FliW [Pseudomonadota bacterium]